MKQASIVTYGCQMNVNESAKIKHILENMGYVMTDDIYSADVIFLNTCTVREGAATQIYGKIGELKQIKSARGTIIGITGCFAQEMGRELIKKFPLIDIVMGNQNIGKIPDMIENIQLKKSKHLIMVDNEDDLPDAVEADFGKDGEASIAITYGCNNFCTYCIVPYVRGRERSVPLEDILNDVKKYVKQGYKEITLLGQNVNSYGKDHPGIDNFSHLLREVCSVEGDFIVRFMSPHPRDFTDELIDTIVSEKKISRALHLPMQSGSSNILKKMNRGYTKENYLSLASKIKEKIPDVSLSTDIIVGFPQETEEDFSDTLDVVDKVRFDTSFMFMYSPRNGTKAAEMDGQIDDNVKSERLQRLIKLQNEISLEKNQIFMGKTIRILVEGPSRKNKDMMTGRTSTNKIVLFKGREDQIGTFVDLKIYRCNTWTLYGELV